MFDTLKTKIFQGKQYIKDIQNAPMREQFRGLPVLNNKICTSCNKCLSICPTGALKLNPLSIDMAKCTFCGECKNICTYHKYVVPLQPISRHHEKRFSS